MPIVNSKSEKNITINANISRFLPKNKIMRKNKPILITSTGKTKKKDNEGNTNPTKKTKKNKNENKFNYLDDMLKEYGGDMERFDLHSPKNPFNVKYFDDLKKNLDFKLVDRKPIKVSPESLFKLTDKEKKMAEKIVKNDDMLSAIMPNNVY